MTWFSVAELEYWWILWMWSEFVGEKKKWTLQVLGSVFLKIPWFQLRTEWLCRRQSSFYHFISWSWNSGIHGLKLAIRKCTWCLLLNHLFFMSNYVSLLQPLSFRVFILSCVKGGWDVALCLMVKKVWKFLFSWGHFPHLV